jgi:polyhydroxyalkanoate synthesis regulator phasin
MTEDAGFLRRLRSRGEEVLTQVSAELSQNPRFVQAMAGAMRGKEKLDGVVGRALRQMNVPTRSELKRVVARIDALEHEVRALKAGARRKPAARRKTSARRTDTARRKATARRDG